MRDDILLYVLIPAFNEELNIAKTVSAVKKYVAKIVVINDGSVDKTTSTAFAAGADIVIEHGINKGQGASILSGIQRALTDGADIAVTIDGDYQHDPDEIPEVVKPILDEEADVVIGSRFFKGIRHIPKTRLLFNLVLSASHLILFGFRAMDSLSGFRAFNRKAMKEMKLTTNRYDWPFEMADIVVRKKLRYREVGVSIRYFNKQNQANWRVAISMVFGMLRYFIRRRFHGIEWIRMRRNHG